MVVTLSASLHFHAGVGDDPRRVVRCEHTGCTVSEDGRASCGAVACPRCGWSGANLTAPDGFDGDQLVRCVCGNSWLRDEAW